MKNKTLHKVILIMVLLPLVAITTTYAWIALVDRTQPILIYSGSLEINAILYQGFDDNDDGIVDYYEEYEDDDLAFLNVVANETFYFKIEIRNDGNIHGHLKIVFNQAEENNLIFADHFSVNYLDPNTEVLTSKILNQTELLLFEEYILEREATYVFEFMILVGENVTNAHYGMSMIIDHIHLQLDQIRPS
ncbi:MAG: hypothetical protein WC964_04465 [Acholeplasmataceae bacterium]